MSVLSVVMMLLNVILGMTLGGLVVGLIAYELNYYLRLRPKDYGINFYGFHSALAVETIRQKSLLSN